MRPSEWTAADTQDNATATATKAAMSNGQRHVCLYVVASFSVAATSKLLQIKKGTTVVVEHYIHGADVLPIEVWGNQNELIEAVLAASGTGSVIGKVQILGYTE